MGLRISWFKNVTFFVRCTHDARTGVAEFFRLPAEFAPPYMSAGKPHSSVKSGDSFTWSDSLHLLSAKAVAAVYPFNE
jgi:hypothetical protein